MVQIIFTGADVAGHADIRTTCIHTVTFTHAAAAATCLAIIRLGAKADLPV